MSENEQNAESARHIQPEGDQRHSKNIFRRTRLRVLSRCQTIHSRVPYLRHIPLPAVLIIFFLIFVNLAVWAICGLVLSTHYSHLLSTAALAYSLGLRHALDADHISAIDLMTRRLIATGQRPVTVGTFFSLGHSTIVVVTSIVVAATAAGISKRFDRFSKVGGIIGTSVSAVFLIALGIMNAYILYKLVVQLRKVIRLQLEQEASEAWKVEGGGVMFRILKKMFKLIDRPWKMYPLGVLFGLGFDTSSEVALLGISSIQGARGTSIWLILVFPVLFTVGMCLIDTIDGALMAGLYLAPMGISDTEKESPEIITSRDEEGGISRNTPDHHQEQPRPQQSQNLRAKSPLTFLYYSIVLTALTVLVALVIGTIQLLTLILNVAVSNETAEKSRFWQGVDIAGQYYDVIGGGICGSFVIVGGISVLCYRPWRRWVERERERIRLQRGNVELLEEERDEDQVPTEEGQIVVAGRKNSDLEGVDDGVASSASHPFQPPQTPKQENKQADVVNVGHSDVERLDK